MVWRKANEEYSPDCILPTVKYYGGNVEVWGYFSRQGVGNLVFIDGILTGEKYKDILKNNLFQSASKMGLWSNFVFHHGNDPEH